LGVGKLVAVHEEASFRKLPTPGNLSNLIVRNTLLSDRP
jgi:hypothetical protein